MKRERLFNAITDIHEGFVDEAALWKPKRKLRTSRWIASIAALLAVAIALTTVILPEWPSGGNVVRAGAIAEAVYPEMAPYPTEGSPNFDAEYSAWKADILAQLQPEGYAIGLESFFAESLQAFLSETSGENMVYSPINVYMSLSILAELTDGNSRRQILDALGCESIEQVRTQANQIWNASYRDDGATTSVLASSLWLNQTVAFNQSTFDLIANNYFASSYSGEMGSPELNTALQNWLNEQTSGLLKDQINNIELGVNTILALATTLHYRAVWSSGFSEMNTASGTFGGTNGEASVDYLNEYSANKYYLGNGFSAVSKELGSEGHMWFILPVEGVAPEELLQNDELLAFIISDGECAESQSAWVHLTVPKFDVSSQIELTSGMMQLGITDVFSSSVSDFTPMTHNETGLTLSQTPHGVRVAIDEEGITAAAYTLMTIDRNGEFTDVTVDFILDRPFLFVTTNPDGLPLFVGIVNQP